jgi:hypothetical protein
VLPDRFGALGIKAPISNIMGCGANYQDTSLQAIFNLVMCLEPARIELIFQPLSEGNQPCVIDWRSIWLERMTCDINPDCSIKQKGDFSCVPTCIP